MMMEKEDLLGLSLSLTSTTTSTMSVIPHRQLSIRPPSSSYLLLHSFPFSCPQKPLLCDLPCHPSDRKNSMIDACRGTGEAGPLLRGIDVNRAPSAMTAAAERNNEEDLAGASSPNSMVSSAAGGNKSAEGDSSCKFTVTGARDEHDDERGSSRDPPSDEEDGDGARKKLRLSKDQSAILEESFKEHSTLNPKQKLALAKQLKLRPRQVEVWFQNRRARTKLKKTEVDCEFLKRCCESLTEENRRLQKEVQELRALKLSPQLYMRMTPPTTLTICPSCERVPNSGTISGAATASTTSKSSSSPELEHRQFLRHHHSVTPRGLRIPLHQQRS